jgi:vancomycin resistance protein VanW
MALHSPLVVTERYRHSFDAFPDSGRTIPFGTGATLFYNHIDLKFYNPTNQTIQIRVWVGEDHLKGEIRSAEPTEYTYSVIERDHKFLTDGEKYFRANKIFREVRKRETGQVVREELVCDNFCEMKYTPPAEATVERIHRP